MSSGLQSSRFCMSILIRGLTVSFLNEQSKRQLEVADSCKRTALSEEMGRKRLTLYLDWWTAALRGEPVFSQDLGQESRAALASFSEKT